MGSSEVDLEPIVIRSKSTAVLQIPEGFAEETVDSQIDPEVSGVPDSVLVGEQLERVGTGMPRLEPDLSVLPLPEGFIQQVDDPFSGFPKGETQLTAAPPVPILDRAKKAISDFFDPKAGGLVSKEQQRADLVRIMADRLKIPATVVDENFEDIINNPSLTSITKIEEEDKPAIAFTQATVEALTFGIFDPDEVIQQEFPVQGFAGSVTGGVITFLTTGAVLQSLGLGGVAITAGEKGRAIFASAPRFLPPAIVTGTTFGTVRGIREVVEMVEKKDFDIMAAGKGTMISFLEGFGIGAAGQFVGPVRRVVVAAGVGVAGAKAEGFTNTEAAVQGTIFGLIEAVGGLGRNPRDLALKNRAFIDMRDSIASYFKKKNPSSTIAKSVVEANKYLNAVFRGEEGIANMLKNSKVRGIEKATQKISKMIRDFKGTKNIDVAKVETDAINLKPISEGGLGKTPSKSKLASEAFLPSAIEPIPEGIKDKFDVIPADPKDLPPPKLTESQQKRIDKKRVTKEKQEAIDAVPGVKNTAERMVREWQAELNVANLLTNAFINDIERVTTKEQREILPFIIEETGVPKELGRPDLEAVFKRDHKKLIPLANQIKKHFQEGWKFMQDNIDDLSAEQIALYVTHIWDLPRTQPTHFGKKRRTNEITNWFITRNKFLKKRYINTYAEGIKLGLKPKNLDIGSIIRIHDNIMNKTIVNNKLLKAFRTLKENGVPLIERIDLAPDPWIKVDHPALTKVLFIPGDPVKGERVSDELRVMLNEMGLAIGRRLSPKVFGKPSKMAGVFRPRTPPEIGFQKYFTNSTLYHEIGHFIDQKLKLGTAFVDQFRDEIYKLNLERIKRLSKQPGGIGRFKTMKQYAESDEEMIAEFFAFFFNDPQKAADLAPNAYNFMMNTLRKDGVMTKLVDFAFEKNGKELVKETSNLLVKLPVKVHPDIVKPLLAVFDQRTSGPIMNAYEMINGILKKTQLSFSLFHHGALGETGIAAIGPLKTAEVTFGFEGKIPFKKIYDAMAKGDFAVYKDLETTKKWVERGMQIGATADIPVKKIQEALNTFAERTKNKGLVGKATQFLATSNEVWDKALWNYYHDTLKLYAAEHMTASIDPNGNIVAQEEEIAQLVNDTFGGQNWTNLMVSPRTVQRLSWWFLSPDWGVSTIRQGMAFTGAGAINKRLSGDLRGKRGRMFWIKALIYAGVGMNLWNRTNRRRDRNLHPELYRQKEAAGLDGDFMWNNALGHKTHLFMGRNEDGTERYLRWGKQFREVPELFMDDLGVSPLTAIPKKIGGKLAPNVQNALVLVTGKTGSGFEIHSLKNTEGWEKVFEQTKFLMLTPLPFAGRDIFQEGQKFELTDLVFPDSKGMTRAKTIKWFRISYERKDQNLFQEVFVNAIANELPALTLMNAAASSLKAEGTSDLTRTLKNIEDIDKAIAKARSEKNIKQVRILNRKKNRFLREQSEIQAIIQNTDLYQSFLIKMQNEFDLQ